MDLKFAQLRNIYQLCGPMSGTSKEAPLSINVPFYQRPYKWESEHINNLIADFHLNMTKPHSGQDNKYFAGAIVTVEKTPFHDIIDGQQRITTLYLLGYLKYLFFRARVDLSIYTGNLPAAGLKLSDFKDSYIKVVGKGRSCDFDVLYTNMVNKLTAIGNLNVSDPNYQKEKNDLLGYFRGTVFLPVDICDEDEYLKKQIAFFKSEELSLQYSRNSLNEKLKDALSRVYFIIQNNGDPCFDIIVQQPGQDDIIVQRYTDAIKSIYEALLYYINLTPNSPQPFNTNQLFDKIDKLIVFSNDILMHLHFCLVRTGNEADAFTLFEVLNDRSLEVEDLELIKNMFFRKYYQENINSISSKEMDNHIEELDKIWGEEVFHPDLGVKKPKLIAYMSFVYFTSDITIDYKTDQKYRHIAIQFLDSVKYNNLLEIRNDFRIFDIAKSILDDVGVRGFNSRVKLLDAINRNDRSITCKTMHLLNIFDYAGVLSALFNIVIKRFIDIELSQNQRNINVSRFKKFLTDLMNDSNHSNTDFMDIHSCAHNIWRLALMTNDYKLPREYAKRIIEDINRNGYDSKRLPLTAIDESRAVNQSKKWLNDWIYNKSPKEDFKIKLLFLMLFQTAKQKGNNYLSVTPSTLSFISDQLELEHLEPLSIDMNTPQFYFNPQDPSEMRENYVNQLGNFMIMDSALNKGKSNSPMYNSYAHYNNMGIMFNHWVTQEYFDAFKTNSKQINVGNTMILVPVEDFFNKRKKSLIDYFMAIIKSNDFNPTRYNL